MKKSYKHKRSEAKWDGTLNDSEMCVDHADSEIVPRIKSQSRAKQRVGAVGRELGRKGRVSCGGTLPTLRSIPTTWAAKVENKNK